MVHTTCAARAVATKTRTVGGRLSMTTPRAPPPWEHGSEPGVAVGLNDLPAELGQVRPMAASAPAMRIVGADSHLKQPVSMALTATCSYSPASKMSSGRFAPVD
jgi:hypothetical protein